MAPLNYRSPEDCMFFTSRKGFLQTEISVYCHPALDWHPKSLCIASDKTTRNCNYLHWSEIWPSCPLQFGGKSLISFMGRENAGARQGYWPRPALSSRPPRRISQMFPLTSQVDPVQCAQSQSRKYHLVFLRQTGRNEEQGAVLYAPPPFRQGEERRGDGSIVQPAGGKPRK